MPGPADIVQDAGRIAVLKAGGLGDLLFAEPALAALRAAYPLARIVLLTSPAGVELLRGRPGPVDLAEEVPPFEKPLPPRAELRLEAFSARMAAERFDVAVQLHGGGSNSNLLLRRLGAHVTAGLRTPDAPSLDRIVPYVYFQSEVLRCLEVASVLGARPVSLEPRLEITPADIAASRAALAEDGRPLAVLHPGAGDRRRWWPADKFAAVGRMLAGGGARVAVVGTLPERRVCHRIAAAVPRAVDLCGRLTLPALTGLLARTRVVVSNDSGPLHLASAVGAPTVGVYWCGNLVNAGPATSTRHRAYAAWRLDCPACGANCMAEGCEHDASFVADVRVEDVARAALELARDAGTALDAMPALAGAAGSRRSR